MASSDKIFLDSDIALDHLADRQPSFLKMRMGFLI
jgi:hypothetical protein